MINFRTISNTFDVNLWIPKTKIGRDIKEKKINSLLEIEKNGLKVLEVEIIDYLFPKLYFSIIKNKIVKKATRGGIRMRHSIYVVVGDQKNYVGIGKGKSFEFREALFQAIRKAKLNLTYIFKNCGDFQCNCNQAHSIFKRIITKISGIKLILFPAPRGTGLKLSTIGKKICILAGVKDIRNKNLSKSKNSFNYALVVFNSLKKNNQYKEDDGGNTK